MGLAGPESVKSDSKAVKKQTQEWTYEAVRKLCLIFSGWSLFNAVEELGPCV